MITGYRISCFQARYIQLLVIKGIRGRSMCNAFFKRYYYSTLCRRTEKINNIDIEKVTIPSSELEILARKKLERNNIDPHFDFSYADPYGFNFHKRWRKKEDLKHTLKMESLLLRMIL